MTDRDIGNSESNWVGLEAKILLALTISFFSAGAVTHGLANMLNKEENVVREATVTYDEERNLITIDIQEPESDDIGDIFETATTPLTIAGSALLGATVGAGTRNYLNYKKKNNSK